MCPSRADRGRTPASPRPCKEAEPGALLARASLSDRSEGLLARVCGRGLSYLGHEESRILGVLERETCGFKIGRCRGGLDFFRPWVTHTLPSAGKDPTGGPGPWARVPGFLCSQQRPENRPGHDRHVRPQRPPSRGGHGLPADSRGFTARPPKPVVEEGLWHREGLAPYFYSTPCGFGALQLGVLTLRLLFSFSVLQSVLGP